ncbi:MAG TPA: hypothetical protein VM869_05610 [Enhygromyxa sp.]|nr:hypothetical protein [Enhygromyxa sp.]
MLGNFLTLLIGPTIPVPAPAELMANLEQVSVQTSDSGRNGFQLSFRTGRDHLIGVVDYPPLITQLLKPGMRAVVISTIDGFPWVLSDGIITNVQLSPSADPNGSKVSVTGQDISVMMELIEQKFPYIGMPDLAIVYAILAKYAIFGVTPIAIPPPSDIPPMVTDPAKVGDGSDFDYLTRLASHYGYVFWVQAGPAPMQNLAYWGPPFRIPNPQKALSFRVGSASNLGSISFTHDGNKPYMVAGVVQEKYSQAPVPVLGMPINIPMAALPAFYGNWPLQRLKLPKDDSGGDVAKAYVKAIAEASKASATAVSASGDLDVGAYGTILRARELVGVRGVGLSFDGLWYVKSVTHTISPGSHKQSFNLEREGTISSVPAVIP